MQQILNKFSLKLHRASHAQRDAGIQWEKTETQGIRARGWENLHPAFPKFGMFDFVVT